MMARAAEAAVLQCLPVVRRVASSVARRLPVMVRREDLVSCGMVAVVEALPRWDEGRSSLPAFMAPRVHGAMIDELRRSDPMRRHARQQAHAIERAEATCMQRLMRQPDVAEIAAEMGASIEWVHGWQAV